ncbi:MULTISPECIES: murein L,D-transpeptidase catalytic domain-containing protein [Flavobacterium]|uniref:murein L,D-transpeptidase catalytic domain-containing protein n=1 Tax=Flavobacterium TaxID=237 RepID=UPI001CBAAA13|nr:MULTISPECIES: murein L,D-transpeptidase catalytic domain family protein [Flavobacterium]MBZ4044162.1 murein L,D-transpeptidase catalytic domain family protein [Flavobacterium hibisci]
MRIFNLILVLIVSGAFISSKPYFKDVPNSLEIERINFRIDEMKSMLKVNSKYNSKIAFFVDMRIPSGKNRFFVYDLQNNKIIDQGLVAHGCGSETGIKGDLKFSNAPNSNCTSLGRYAIGSNYNGMFGKAYRLSGLDETNSNAYKRAIVLHHYSAVPYEEQDHYISRSHGCPMVNEQFFKRIEKIIDSSKSNILLDIYY